MSDEGQQSIHGIQEVVNRLVESYSGSGVARAAMVGSAGVPIIGAAGAVLAMADALLTTRAAKLAADRWNRLLAELGARVDQLGEEKLDRSFLESEDFLDLLWQALIAAAQTRSQEKLEAYATILAGSLSVERPHDLDPEALLDALSGLSPQEVLALSVFWKLGGEGATKVSSEFSLDRFVLQRLSGAGFVYEQSGAILGYSGGDYLATSALQTLMLLVNQFEPSQGQTADQ
jgi:hypothetical protein